MFRIDGRRGEAETAGINGTIAVAAGIFTGELPAADLKRACGDNRSILQEKYAKNEGPELLRKIQGVENKIKEYKRKKSSDIVGDRHLDHDWDAISNMYFEVRISMHASATDLYILGIGFSKLAIRTKSFFQYPHLDLVLLTFHNSQLTPFENPQLIN